MNAELLIIGFLVFVGIMSDCQKLGREVKVSAVIERYELVSDGPMDSGPVNRGLEVFKARISLVQSGQHAEYFVKVTYDGNSWQLKKRFSEFAALHDVLRKRVPVVPEIPSKSVVRQFGTEHLELRKQGLTTFLQEVCRRRDLTNCQEVQQFLGLTERVPAFRQPHASEPVQAAEVHEAAFGVADFEYDPMQGYLLLGATDCSWTSRMDTKITNIKLPWEPAAPNLPTSQMSLWRQSPADLRFDMQFTCRFTASISRVVLSVSREKGFCLCGLSDGTVGYHAIKGDAGVNNSGNTLPLLRHTSAVVALGFDQTEQWVISASKDSALIVYDMRRQMIQCEVQTPAACSSMHFSETQKRLFTGLQNGRIVVWDTSKMPLQQLANIPDGAETPAGARMGAVAALDYDAVTSTLFTGTKEGFALWAVKSSNLGCWGRCVGQIKDLNVAPTAVAWANSSREILAGFSNGSVIVFDVDLGEATYALNAHKDEVTAIMWLDAPRRLLTASKDKTLKIWDFPSLRRMSLDDLPSVGTTPPSVSVSTAPYATPPGSSGSRPARPAGGGARLPLGGDPLLSNRPRTGSGGYPGDAGNSTASTATTSFGSAANPLSRPQGRSNETAGSTASPESSFSGPAATIAPPISADDSLGASDTLRSPALKVGDALSRKSTTEHVVKTSSQAPKVAGAKPNSLIREDSDDDLHGWDS